MAEGEGEGASKGKDASGAARTRPEPVGRNTGTHPEKQPRLPRAERAAENVMRWHKFTSSDDADNLLLFLLQTNCEIIGLPDPDYCNTAKEKKEYRETGCAKGKGTLFLCRSRHCRPP